MTRTTVTQAGAFVFAYELAQAEDRPQFIYRRGVPYGAEADDFTITAHHDGSGFGSLVACVLPNGQVLTS